MSDYASCPTCHGSGLIPLEVAERIEAHDRVSYDAARQLQREREAEMVRARTARIKHDAEYRLALVEDLLGPSRKAPS